MIPRNPLAKQIKQITEEKEVKYKEVDATYVKITWPYTEADFLLYEGDSMVRKGTKLLVTIGKSKLEYNVKDAIMIEEQQTTRRVPDVYKPVTKRDSKREKR